MMPAGTYYVGDLCYVMHDEWDEFCDITIVGNRCLDGEFNLKDGRRFATYGTAYGDGTYYDEEGRKYHVDAGLIGCILLSDIDTTNPKNNTKLGQVINFSHAFITSGGRDEYGWDGYICFDLVRIATKPRDYDEEVEQE